MNERPSTINGKGGEARFFSKRTFFGGCSAVISGMTVHPIDLMRVRMERQGEGIKSKVGAEHRNVFHGFYNVFNKEGLRGFYKGASVCFIRECTFSTIVLGSYEPYKRLIGASDPNAPLYMKAAAASMSGMTGALISSPQDLVKVRMQGDTGIPKTLRWHVRQVYDKGGLSSFYKGVQASIIWGALRKGSQLSSYDHSKHEMLRMGWFKEGLGVHTAAAATAGFVTSMLTSPVDLIRTRYMNFGQDGRPNYNGLIDCAVKTWKTEGTVGLYKGFGA